MLPFFINHLKGYVLFKKMTNKELIALAQTNNVELEGGENKSELIEALENVGVKAPSGVKASERISEEPVKFMATTGRVWIRDTRTRITEYGKFDEQGLTVDFLDYGGEPVGGYSRLFYPTKDLHEDSNRECDCKHCLKDVREFIAKDKFGLATDHHIVEVASTDASMPFPQWTRINAKDIAGAYDSIGFDIDNAIRFERENEGRLVILEALDELAELVEMTGGVDAADILDASVSVD